MEISDPRDYYIEEASELLSEIEARIVDLEKSPEDYELLNTVFRALHTIKGSGSMFGYDEIASFTHEVETVFDYLRDGKLLINKKIIDSTLMACDHISVLLKNPQNADKELQEKLVASFRELMSKVQEYAPHTAEPTPPLAEKTQEEPRKTYRIEFKPGREIFLRGIKILPLLNELSDLGEALIIANSDELPNLEDLNPEHCYTTWTAILTTSSGINAIKDVFIFVEDYSRIKIDVIDEGDVLGTEDDYKKIGEILSERGYMNVEEINKIISKKKLFGEMAVEQGIVTPDKVESALAEQKYVREMRKRRNEVQTGSTIRVKNEKLDYLVDLVGELVTLQARLSGYANKDGEAELLNISETLEGLTSELRETTMSIRMVPLTETFRSFFRLVRDLSHELGKNVELVTYGAETELDKNVIDMLKDPLVHIIRNSVDHGIEHSKDRAALGKPEKGTITQGAAYSGANVLIEISDDGRVLDPEKIRKKGEEKGLIKSGSEIGEHELFNLIFEPGFSTSEKATGISGRGVGMDVVRKNIERLRGTVEVASEKNRGTTITIRLPLTLSIIDGLLLEVGDGKYIVNLSDVVECFELTGDLLGISDNNSIANIRGEAVPFINLRTLFSQQDASEGNMQLVVVNTEDQKTGIAVDRVLGQTQIVIKPLSIAFRNVEEVSGSTILGDGSIALILDVNKITQKAREEKTSRIAK